MSKYKCGEIVTGYVTGIEKYGIFVCIDKLMKIKFYTNFVKYKNI